MTEIYEMVNDLKKINIDISTKSSNSIRIKLLI